MAMDETNYRWNVPEYRRRAAIFWQEKAAWEYERARMTPYLPLTAARQKFAAEASKNARELMGLED